MKLLKTYVFIYLKTGDLFLVDEFSEGAQFHIPDSLYVPFSEEFALNFYNFSECLGEL